jgi:hypothetical protein
VASHVGERRPAAGVILPNAAALNGHV